MAQVVVNTEGPASEQAEGAAKRRAQIWASDDQVFDWVEHAKTANPDFIPCKERNRHAHPTIFETGANFSGVDPKTGLYVRRVVCRACVVVEEVTLWDVKHYRGKIISCVPAGRWLDYLDSDYLNDPGMGRMRPRQIKAALATLALKGQSFKEFRVSIMNLPNVPAADAEATQDVSVGA